MVIVGVNLYIIQHGSARSVASAASPAPSGPAGALAHGESNGVRRAPAVEADAAAPESTAAPTAADAGSIDDRARDDRAHGDEAPQRDKSGKRKDRDTVEGIAKRACSTAPIEGLSRQIVAEARCLDANAFARVPARKNLQSAAYVFLYLDAPARDSLLRVLDAYPKRVMKVHSALRTVAQQYLLSRWAAGKRCGIQLATAPGESNHETGLALDVGSPATWRAAFESEGFRWLGAVDPVHFEFVGAGSLQHVGLDIQAFQRLWNRNHPDDTIGETGRYDAPTERRLKRAPAHGFPIGPRC